MPAEETAGGKAFEEALETLRRRGYLGRRGAGLPRRAVRTAWAMVAAGLAVVVAGLALAAVLPTRPAAVSVTVLLLVPLYLGALLLCWLLVLLAEALHRRGLGVGASAAGTAVVGGSGALGWVFLAGRPWAPPFGVAAFAGLALAVSGTALLMRGLARAVVLRILRRPSGGPGVVPRLWRVTVLTLGAVALLLGAGMLGPRGTARGDGRGESLHVRPGTRRLAVVGVDGAARAEVELLADQRPALEGIRRWCWASLKEHLPGGSLPVRWITVATGMAPGRRGVATFRQVAVGRRGPVLLLPPLLRRIVVALWSPLGVVEEQTVPAAHRGVPTVWEMASRAGLTVRVLGWWGSFPPRRVRGVVASERWLLTGVEGPETVFPDGPEAELGELPGTAPLDMDRRALGALGDEALADPSLVMVYLPGWWLERRRSQHGGEPAAPLLAARALEPHLRVLGEVLERLLGHGFAVCIVGMERRGGWTMWSTPGGREDPVGPADLVETWLDALGLPPPAGLQGKVRRDLSGVSGGAPASPVRYGPPPPLARAAPAGEGAAQLELLKSLGYLN